MWPYWLLFLAPAFLAISTMGRVSKHLADQRWSLLWRLTFIVLALMVGLRHEVGGDWGNYLGNLEQAEALTFSETLSIGRGDPADGLLKWVATHSGLGIYLINCVYGVLFSLGLLTFCRMQPRPWLALTVAVPYLIIVVAMGYSRQGVAIGLVMLGLISLEKKNVVKFVIWIALAAMFHKSAVILVPLAVVAGTRRRLWTVFWVGVAAAVLFSLLLLEHLDNLVSGYITDQYDSSGAAIRVAMNALPAALLLGMRNRFQLSTEQRAFWTWMALGALAFVILLFVSPSSTAVDRVALYWIPLQIFVWSRLPDAMGRSGAKNAGWVYSVVAYSAVVQFVWIFFATHSLYWLPYKFYPWVWLWQ
jgi:hypothetical protein